MLSSTKSRLAGKMLLQTLFFFLLVTQICFAQWVQIGLGNESIKDITARNQTIFAVTSNSGKVYRSIDNATNWTVIVDSNVVDVAISATGKVFMIKDSLFGYFPSRVLYSSLDNGVTWTRLSVTEQLPPPLGIPLPWNIAVGPTGLLVCGINNDYLLGETWFTIALSTDDGVTWTGPGWDTFSGLITDFSGQNILTYGKKDVSCGYSPQIHISYDSGQSWIFLGWPPTGPTNTLNLCSNGKIFYGGGSSDVLYGYFMSIDSCQSWERVSYLIPDVALSLESVAVLIGIDCLGVFLFSDNGDSLGSRNEGLTNLNIHSLTIDNNNYVYAGTDNGVWRRPVSEVTSVEEVSITLPADYNLYQNFPNPFNPSTTFRYSIPQLSKVVIKVYDILGNEIALLMDEEKTVGTYELTWHTANQPSGVYFYQLKAGNYIETKKMLLLK